MVLLIQLIHKDSDRQACAAVDCFKRSVQIGERVHAIRTLDPKKEDTCAAV